MESFFELAQSRYSCRAFSDAPVEDEKIEKMLESSRLAPTARNFQPQKIYVVRNEEMRKKLAEVTPCTFGAPVIFVVCYDEDRVSQSRIYEGHNFGQTDAAIVNAHLVFEAAELGLGSCWVGWFVEKEVKEVLGLPENIRVCNLLPVGYASEAAKPSVMHTTYRPKAETVEYID